MAKTKAKSKKKARKPSTKASPIRFGEANSFDPYLRRDIPIYTAQRCSGNLIAAHTVSNPIYALHRVIERMRALYQIGEADLIKSATTPSAAQKHAVDGDHVLLMQSLIVGTIIDPPMIRHVARVWSEFADKEIIWAIEEQSYVQHHREAPRAVAIVLDTLASSYVDDEPEKRLAGVAIDFLLSDRWEGYNIHEQDDHWWLTRDGLLSETDYREYVEQ